MDVIIIESEVFRRIEAFHQEAIDKMLEAKKKEVKNSFTLLTAQEVADMVKLDVTTVLKHKEYIGYISLGNKNLFELPDVINYFRSKKITAKKRL